MTKKTRDTDVAFIQALAELLNNNDLTEIEVMRDYGTDDSLNVRVSRVTVSAPVAAAVPVAAPAAAPVSAPAAAPAAAAAANGNGAA